MADRKPSIPRIIGESATEAAPQEHWSAGVQTLTRSEQRCWTRAANICWAKGSKREAIGIIEGLC